MRKLFVLILLLMPGLVRAQTTYTASSCSQANVQTAVTNELASAVDGDIIAIPPCGSTTWTTGINVTFTHSVTLQGAGAVSATTGGSSTTGTDQTILLNHTSGGTMFGIVTTAGKSFRMTGIDFKQDGSSPFTASGTVGLAGASSSVRIDHNHFQLAISGTSISLNIGGSVLGVADHDFFDDSSGLLTNDIAFHNGQSWNGVNSSTDCGGGVGSCSDGSWTDTDHWGSSKFFYIEDSRFVNGDLSDGHDGARYVLRHSSVTGSDGEQMFNHGLTNARGRGVRAAEIYSNSFHNSGNNSNPPYSLNSGTLLFWGNTVDGGFQNAVVISYDFRTTAGGGGNYNYTGNWGQCGTAAGGPTNWDGNLNTSGYACIDQPGRGAGDLLTGGSFPGTVNNTTGTVAWPHQALTPIYVWLNTYNPQFFTGTPLIADGSGGSGASIAANNRDYYQQFGNGGNGGSFNGTAGVGTGLLSARPSTCTGNTDPETSSGAPGVGYWATDTTTLYVCNPTNTWTAYYTPYTYPHPLTGGPPATAPTCSTPGSLLPQTVTCSTPSSGAIMCYTTNGTAPATDTLTGCTTGTLYSGAITISVMSTLKIVAGGTGFADSSEADFTYPSSSGSCQAF